MKKGILILKPDFYEKIENAETLKHLLEQHKLKSKQKITIENFGNFLKKYREYDSSHYSHLTEEEKKQEVNNTMYATFTYSTFFTGKKGTILIFESDNEDDLYQKLFAVKQSYRKYVKEKREYRYYIDKSSSTWRPFKLPAGVHQEISSKVEEAYVNGIHLEDKEFFDQDVCYSFCLKNGYLKNKETEEDLSR